MKKYFEFFSKVKKLKEMPRTGWVLREVKSPETVAEHTFGVAFLSWLLGSQMNLEVQKLIKIALSHDLCEVFAGDKTPFWYYPNLPKDKILQRKVLQKWARLSMKERKRAANKKRKVEEKALLNLLKFLDKPIKREIFQFWLEYENGSSPEGKLVRQLNRVETLIQALEYFKEKTSQNWWEWAEEIAEDKIVLDFMKTIEERFCQKKEIKENLNLKNILEFFLKINRLKKIKEGKYSIAAHSFDLALACWIFGEKIKKLNLEKLLKMALSHQIQKWQPSKIQKTPRTLHEMFQRYQENEENIKNLVSNLDPDLSNEILTLWREFQLKESKEALFLNQIDSLLGFLENFLL